MRKSSLKLIFWAIVAATLLMIPWVFGIVKTNTFVELAMSAMFAVSLNLLISSGLFSFGHALYFGTGAYACALILLHLEGFPLIPVILLAGMAAGLLALILSPILARVTGTAHIMLTLAFAQLMYVICLKFREVTNGEDGLLGYTIPPLRIPGIVSFDMENTTHFYYFAMTVIAVCIWAMRFVTKTPFGCVMVGLRDDPERIDHLGFRVPIAKAVVMVISGFFAGIAGSLFALFQVVVAVDSVLHLFVSFAPIMAIFVGGVGTFVGPIIGSAAILLVEELAVTYTERIELISGLLFIFIVMLAPRGIIGLYATFKA